MFSSEVPSPYSGAVSIQLTPPATARCSAAQRVASLSLMRIPPVTPPPNAISEISRPVRPKKLFFMAASSLSTCSLSTYSWRRSFGPQLEALNLAGRGLGQLGTELDHARIFVRRELAFAMVLQGAG